MISATLVSFRHIHLNAATALVPTEPVGLFSLNWEGLNQLMYFTRHEHVYLKLQRLFFSA